MSPDGAGALRRITIFGSARERGEALGRFAREAVHGHLLHSAAWQELTRRRADPRIAGMTAIVRDRFPRYWAELEGLAAGLELPMEDVFLWNCRGDIGAFAPDGCTTVQLPGSPHVIGHNEDGDPGFAGHCALAHVTPDDGNSFTAFVYPGSLPGHTFAATSAGIVMTVNNIRALDVGAGAPRMVLTRALLDADDLDSALATLTAGPRAGAFHLTLAMVGDPRLVGVEFTAEMVSVREIRRPDIHANHLVHSSTGQTPQIITGSSASRQRRGTELLDETGSLEPAERARRILWDTGESRFPVYRSDPDDEDVENTLASAVFRVGSDSLDWCVYDTRNGAACFASRQGSSPAAA